MRFAICALTTLVAIPVFAQAEAPPEKKKKLAVLDVQVKHVDEETGAIFSEVLAAEVSKVDRYEVMSGSDIKATLSFEQQKQVLGCDDSSCMAELGGALGADLLVVSQVGKVGDTFVVSIKLIDVRTAKAHKRVYETVEGKVDTVLKTIRSGVGQLFDLPDHLGATVVAKDDGHGHDDNSATASSASRTQVQKSGGFPLVPAILWGAGAVALGVGTYFGITALDKASLANDPTQVGSQAAIADAKTSGVVAPVTIAGGAALVAGGLVAFLLSGNDEPAAVSVTPVVLPDGGGAVVTVGGW